MRIEADSNLDERRTMFAWTDAKGGDHVLSIVEGDHGLNGEYYVMLDDQGVRLPNWTAAVVRWNHQVAAVLDSFRNQDAKIDGPTALKITGLSSGGFANIARHIGVKGTRMSGATKYYTAHDIARILTREVKTRGNTAGPLPAKTVILIREAIENPIVSGLSTEDVELLQARYGLDGNPSHTLEDIAQDRGVSREAIRTRLDRVLGRLERVQEKTAQKR